MNSTYFCLELSNYYMYLVFHTYCKQVLTNRHINKQHDILSFLNEKQSKTKKNNNSESGLFSNHLRKSNLLSL